MASSTSSASNLTAQILSRPIHSQQRSPLYSKLPQEIRDQIFAYALTPYTPNAPPPPPKVSALWPVTPKPPKKNPWNPIRTPYPTNSTYSRPGQSAKVHHPTNLLLVCRSTYLETNELPVKLAAHNFYAPAKSGPSDVLGPEEYFSRMTASQRQLVKQVRVFSNVGWLLDGGLDNMVSHEAVQGIELLNIVIRWCDWRGWSNNQKLSLSSRPDPVSEEEEEEEDEDAEMEELVLVPSNQSPEQQEQEFFDHLDASNTVVDETEPVTKYASVREALQAAIATLRNLKSVRISIEAPYVKADELEAQIRDVLYWNLRLNGKRAREADKTVTGSVQRRFEWEAPMCAWSDFCAHCGGGIGDDKACEERKRRRMRKLGPRVQGAVVRWN